MEYVADTHILSEILKGYSAGNPERNYNAEGLLTKPIAKALNDAIDSDGLDDRFISSAFAFVEILNKFNAISKGTFDIEKVVGFLAQPPAWFIIEPFSYSTIDFLKDVPKRSLSGQNIELADAIHIATAMQRGPNTFLATHDTRIADLNLGSLSLKLIS